jgi:ATP-binding cassette subfamily F protein 3
MIILDVNKLSMDFGYGKLFEDLSFSLNDGESISIVGPNGCGKSTLLKIIAGEYKCDSGDIFIRKDVKLSYLDQTSSDKQDDRAVMDKGRIAFWNGSNMGRNSVYGA